MGVPCGAIFTRRRGRAVVTYIAIGAWPPDKSTRYTSNVPAGTVIVSVPLTVSVTDCTYPLPDRNMGTVNDALVYQSMAGSSAVSRLSSIDPAAMVVSMVVVTGPAADGMVAVPLARPSP
jgi:hypothetical protein